MGHRDLPQAQPLRAAFVPGSVRDGIHRKLTVLDHQSGVFFGIIAAITLCCLGSHAATMQLFLWQAGILGFLQLLRDFV